MHDSVQLYEGPAAEKRKRCLTSMSMMTRCGGRCGAAAAEAAAARAMAVGSQWYQQWCLHCQWALAAAAAHREIIGCCHFSAGQLQLLASLAA